MPMLACAGGSVECQNVRLTIRRNLVSCWFFFELQVFGPAMAP